jgi:hypothetical protein
MMPSTGALFPLPEDFIGLHLLNNGARRFRPLYDIVQYPQAMERLFLVHVEKTMPPYSPLAFVWTKITWTLIERADNGDEQFSTAH